MSTTEWMLRDGEQGAVIWPFSSLEAAQAWRDRFALDSFRPEPMEVPREPAAPAPRARFTRRHDGGCRASAATRRPRRPL